MHHNTRLLAIATTGLLFIAHATMLPGAFASTTSLSSSTYQAWEFDKLDDALATSPITDVSGDGIDDLAAADDKSIYLIDSVSLRK